MEIFTTILGIVNTFFKSKSEVEQKAIALELQKALTEAQVLKSQADINLEEAKSDNIFVAGWRPFVGWTCGAAFAWLYVVQPVFVLFYSMATGHLPPLPEMDTANLIGMLTGLLGLGAFRTIEKIKNK